MRSSISISIAVSLLTLSPSVSAFFRLPCGDPLTIERVDPLMNPNVIGGHVHTVNGGSNFSPFATFATLRASTCSSCSVLEDMSAYWTPQLYFQMADNTFKSVQQTGGGLIYYLFRFNSADTGGVQAFPSGLKMVVGSPNTRSYVDSLTAQAIGWNCLGTNGTSRTPGFPLTNCPNGLRGEIRFPSCWNGKDLDSPDHISHMAYPIGGETGPCPSGFGTRIVTLFYETMWSIDPMNSSRPQAKNPSQPFVLANGDPTGFSYHGDFMDAWTPGVLQQAVNNCTSASGVIEECSILHLTDPAISGKCQKTPDVNEVVLGNLATLPGCNLVSSTTASTLSMCPSYVAPQVFTKPVAFTGAAAPPGSQVLSNTPQVVMAYKNYTYVDCYSDRAPVRALLKQIPTINNTVNACLDAALAAGAKYVGIEYYGECWTDSKLANTSLPIGYGQCGAPCRDNPLQICGGTTGTMDLYIFNGAFPTAASPSSTLKATTPTSSTVSTTPSPAPVKVVTPPAAVVQSFNGYNYSGCYSDKDSTRALLTPLSPSLKTVQGCLSLAKTLGYSSAGIEYGGECWAGHYLLPSSTVLPSTSCSMTCTGDLTQLCGGPNAISYYKFAGVLANEPTTVTTYKNWNVVGCYTDQAPVRALANRLTTTAATVGACLDAATAAGYSMAGLEYYGQCFGANSLASTSVASPNGFRDCQAVCTGNSTQFCGGTSGQFDYYKTGAISGTTIMRMKLPKRDSDIYSRFDNLFV